MARSEMDKALDAFLEKRDPMGKKAAKARLFSSSGVRRVRNTLEAVPKYVLVKELLKREMAEKARKDKTAKQRERREELRQKKTLHSPAE